MRSCTAWSTAPHCGHTNFAPRQPTSKSMRCLAVSSFTSSTTHGFCKPSALVNSASIPTFTCELLNPELPPGGHVHRPTGARLRPSIVGVAHDYAIFQLPGESDHR